jgi:hypothetical protein
MKEKFSETPKSPIPTRFEIVTLERPKEKKKKLYCLLPRSSELFDQPSRRRYQKKNFEIVRLKCNKEEEEEEIVDGLSYDSS